ncbi:MAG: hypothetical protein Q7R41_05170 [Phycisphaerales bacterium]|nr:hypothetical protein [Phycisphaerales bacterium]
MIAVIRPLRGCVAEVLMLCRGGIVVGGGGEVGPMPSDAKFVRPHPLDNIAAARRPLRRSLVFASAIVLTLLLAALPGRMRIAPLVESDYCYLLTAADRLCDGQGLTATQPVAPFVPWEWRYDWGFLTQWPAGYPLLVAGVRKAFGLSALDACRWIAVVVCAAALAGWFTWIRRNVPYGVTGILLAAVGAGSCVTVASLTNPSTDAILVAVLPYILLLVCAARWDDSAAPDAPSRRREMSCVAAAGLLAGVLFWIRYASLFVPFAVGLYLFMEWRRRATGLHRLLVFGFAAALPIFALLLLNRTFGQAPSAAAQLNLGSSVGFDFSWVKFAQALWMFTDLGFYDHRPIAHWLYATWPVALVIGVMAIKPVRAAVPALLETPAIRLGACLVVALLGMLVVATTLFGAKYDYLGLDRYYLPVRPLYFLLFLSPLMMIPRRAVRATLCVALLIAGLWIAQQEWARTYARWTSSDRPTTPSGAWSRCFEPRAIELYAWLAAQDDPNLIVVSNFQEYITLETKIPAIPIPPNRETLGEWVSRISESRGVTRPRVLFVLDPDNKWRSQWIAAPDKIIREFQLAPCDAAPEGVRAYVFEPDDDATPLAHARGSDWPVASAPGFDCRSPTPRCGAPAPALSAMIRRP